MLSLLDDEAALTEAIEIARGLGAAPLAERLAGRMRELGLARAARARARRRAPIQPVSRHASSRCSR